MSTGPIDRKSKGGPRKVIRHEILAASSAITTAVYKGDGNYGVAPNATEATGGEWPIAGLDPNKKYVITHMRVVLGAAPDTGKSLACTLRQNGVDSTDGVVTISDLETEGETTLQDLVTHGAYVTVKFVGTGTPDATSGIRVYLIIEEV